MNIRCYAYYALSSFAPTIFARLYQVRTFSIVITVVEIQLLYRTAKTSEVLKTALDAYAHDAPLIQQILSTWGKNI